MPVPLWGVIIVVLWSGLCANLLIYNSAQAALARIERDYWKKRACLDAYMFTQYRDILSFTVDRMDRETVCLVALRLKRIEREMAAGKHERTTTPDKE